MLTRVLAALCLAPPFLGLLWMGGWPLGILLGVLVALGTQEFAQLAGAKRSSFPAVVAGFLMPWIAVCGGAPGLLKGILVAGLWTLFPLGLPPVAPEKARASLAGLASLVAVALPFSLFALLRQAPGGLAASFAFLTLIWVQDSAAYFVGIRFGRRRLSPEISPKKSWEGALGGLVFGLLASAWVFFRLGGRLEAFGLFPATATCLGVLVALTAQFGDLVESGWKRSAGVKDSGDWIPGHGGILDRFDGFSYGLLALFALLP